MKNEYKRQQYPDLKKIEIAVVLYFTYKFK